VWNLQPDGGDMGLGISPASGIRILDLCMSGSGTGTLERSASVYGWIGFVYTASTGAYSTNDPEYIIPILCET
jgi:hypothetical protein